MASRPAGLSPNWQPSRGNPGDPCEYRECAGWIQPGRSSPGLVRGRRRGRHSLPAEMRDMGPAAERRRIVETYASPGFRSKHDPARAGNRYLEAMRWNVVIAALRGLRPVARAARYLEVGCGSGEGLVKVAGAGLGLQEIVGI